MDSTQAIKTAVGLNFDVFREPRGVMRIFQFIFSICAFATTTGFTNVMRMTLKCGEKSNSTITVDLPFDYPFRLEDVTAVSSCPDGVPLRLIGNFSSDAQFFVATGVLSFLYCICIVIVYVMLSNMYQTNSLLPLTDFILTVILSVFWLSGSGAWANGLNGLKSATDPQRYLKYCADHFSTNQVCQAATCGNYSSLNISVILGFLNFFLWASDLWFLYKETPWFKMKQTAGGVGTAA